MKAADPVTVDLYRLAYNAGRPVTFDELVEGMPSAYQNDANRWYVQKLLAEGKDNIPAEPWSASTLRSVKADWLQVAVDDMLRNKQFIPEDADGRRIKPGQHHPPGVRYSAVKEIPANRKGGPPMVWEEALDRHLVRWTPEIGATGRRHVAGIKFRDAAARIQAAGSKATKHDLEEALALAMEALAYGPSSQP
jgi:hypothetical protein